MLETLDFFGWKCPYTGKDLTGAIVKGEGDYAIDHIIPQNKEYCGLNVKGNLVYTDKEANKQKGKQTAEEFLLNNQGVLKGVSKEERMKRLEKIKEFQRECKYDPTAIQQSVSSYFAKIYDEIRAEQEARIDKAIAMAGLTPIADYSSQKAVRTRSQSQDIPVILSPSNPEDFKTKFLERKMAIIKLTYADETKDKEHIWKADKFDASSNVMGNIKSRPFWRKRVEQQLVSVEITVI